MEAIKRQFVEKTNSKIDVFNAISIGNQQRLEQLLQQGTLPSTLDVNGNPLLTRAIFSDNVAAVKLLLQRGANPDQKGFAGRTPLHYAALLAAKNCMKVLVEQGKASLSAVDEAGLTPLHLACQNGDMKTVEYCTTAGADLNAESKNGFTPLMQATINSQLAIVDLLLKSGADVRKVDNKNGQTALHHAARLGASRMVSKLVEAGAQYGMKDKHGAVPADLTTEPEVKALLVA